MSAFLLYHLLEAVWLTLGLIRGPNALGSAWLGLSSLEEPSMTVELLLVFPEISRFIRGLTLLGKR